MLDLFSKKCVLQLKWKELGSTATVPLDKRAGSIAGHSFRPSSSDTVSLLTPPCTTHEVMQNIAARN